MLRATTLLIILFAPAPSLLAEPDAGTFQNAELLSSKHIHRRGSFDNCRIRFTSDKKGHVAFMGGSITEMNGYRPMVMAALRHRFPDTEFTFTDAGIASTCSTTGAFRLESDVLSKGQVDLFIVEFAVNDDQDAGHTRDACIRGMEGIVRHLRNHNPHADIVIVFFVNPGMLTQVQQGKMPLSMEAHEAVAKHYDVSTVHLAHEVAEQIDKGELTWAKFGGTHPKPYGNGIAARMVDTLLAEAWKKDLTADAKSTAHPMPDKPLDALNYERGRFIDPKHATLNSGWALQVPGWKSLPGSKRDRFTSIPILEATKPGAELTLKFNGTAIGAYVVAGPDAGMLEASVDGGAFEAVDLFHRFSKGLHYPRTVMFAAQLKPGDHVLTLRVSKEKNDASRGHAARIMQFTAN